MSITATVKNGVVILPPELKLPDGLQVELTIPKSAGEIRSQDKPISGAEFTRLWNSRSKLDEATAQTVAENIAEINKAERPNRY